MIAALRFASVLALLCFSSGCYGEAAVRYWGSVVAAPSPGYSFDAKENPGGLAPIRGAEVRLCVCDKPCACKDEGKRGTTDIAGHYDLPGAALPGIVGTETFVVVRASADGFAPVTYTVSYDKRTDADRAREPTDGQRALNFRLGPAAH
jgi:hypothetical protein